jgi:hypothetical protein
METGSLPSHPVVRLASRRGLLEAGKGRAILTARASEVANYAEAVFDGDPRKNVGTGLP